MLNHEINPAAMREALAKIDAREPAYLKIQRGGTVLHVLLAMLDPNDKTEPRDDGTEPRAREPYERAHLILAASPDLRTALYQAIKNPWPAHGARFRLVVAPSLQTIHIDAA